MYGINLRKEKKVRCFSTSKYSKDTKDVVNEMVKREILELSKDDTLYQNEEG